MSRPAVFLDRDGVINRNRSDYVKSWEEFQFLPGALGALRQLAELEWPIVVVSNQSMVGRGLATFGALEHINKRMLADVARAGGRIDGIYCCPHRPEDGCGCRKPLPGLLKIAAAELGLDLTRGFLVGDSEGDVIAARAVGCWPLLVRTGRGLEQLARLSHVRGGAFTEVRDLGEAVAWVLSHSGWQRARHHLVCRQPREVRRGCSQ